MVRTMTRKALVSFLGVLAAGAASLATSQPPPDWTLEDSAEGEITLAPETEETVLELRAASEVVSSSLSLDVALDPAPARNSDGETPVAVLVGTPTEGDEPSSLEAVPTTFEVDDKGFETRVVQKTLEPKTGSRELRVRIVWPSAGAGDASTSTGVDRSYYGSSRPVAPRRLTKIKWRAKIYAEGYDDRPAGAKVDIQAAPAP